MCKVLLLILVSTTGRSVLIDQKTVDEIILKRIKSLFIKIPLTTSSVDNSEQNLFYDFRKFAQKKIKRSGYLRDIL